MKAITAHTNTENLLITVFIFLQSKCKPNAIELCSKLLRRCFSSAKLLLYCQITAKKITFFQKITGKTHFFSKKFARFKKK